MDEPIAAAVALDQARRKKIDEKQGLLALIVALVCTGSVALWVVPDVVAPTLWVILLVLSPFGLSVAGWWRFNATAVVLVIPETTAETPGWRRLMSCLGLIANSLTTVVLWVHVLAHYSTGVWPFASANIHEWGAMKIGCLVVSGVSILVATVGDNRVRFLLVAAGVVSVILWSFNGATGL